MRPRTLGDRRCRRHRRRPCRLPPAPRRSRRRNRRTPTAAPTTTVPVGTIPDPAACAEGLTLDEGVLTVATGEPAFPPYVIDDDPRAARASRRPSPTPSPAARLRRRRRRVGAHAVRRGDPARPEGLRLQPPAVLDHRGAPGGRVVQRAVLHEHPGDRRRPPTRRPSGRPRCPTSRTLRLGVAAGTTSLALVEDVIQPDERRPGVQRQRRRRAGAVDPAGRRLVVDLPTALFLAAVEIEGGVVVGQFPPSRPRRARTGACCSSKDNPLVECVDYALLRLRESGELEEITTTWMEEATEVPVIDLE